MRPCSLVAGGGRQAPAGSTAVGCDAAPSSKKVAPVPRGKRVQRTDPVATLKSDPASWWRRCVMRYRGCDVC